eukprot:COSAG05_NODE_18605_length_306_cov_0.391304_2_plen_33_part_00
MTGSSENMKDSSENMKGEPDSNAEGKVGPLGV